MPNGSKLVGANYFTMGRTRRGEVNFAFISAILVLSIIAAGWFASRWGSSKGANDSQNTAAQPLDSISFPVNIRRPDGPPRVYTGLNDIHGQPITVSCSTCHATREPNFGNKKVNDMDEFHTLLEFAHGEISCLSCHNSKDYDSLKLADNTRIEFADVMTLCAQCHGQQMREFEKGVHGGMTGYWDLERGPQNKNNCVDCHDPHLPKFPMMQPTFKPHDRFLEKVDHK